MDGVGGPAYIGTGCFHRREILCGRSFTEDYKQDWDDTGITAAKPQQHIDEIEEQAKSVATCAYEASNTQWGREMGVKYGCPLEDVISHHRVGDPVQRVCVGLLQPAEEGVPGPRSDDACSDAAAAQEVRRGQLLHSALAVLLGVVWAWKDRAAAAAGLLHLRSMSSKVVAYAVLRYRPVTWPQGIPLFPEVVILSAGPRF